MHDTNINDRTVLVTGAARRIGRAICETLHNAGMNVAVHYRESSSDADKLVHRLNEARDGSAKAFPGDLLETAVPAALIKDVVDWRGGLDALVNNASTFYPTPLADIDEAAWTDLVGTNLKAPLFLAQAAAPYLRQAGGNIVNIVDIHATRPLRDHAVYGSAKAGLAMLTRSLAKDLAPDVRVNGVAPGAIAWPENGMTDDMKETILKQVPLGRAGEPSDIAAAVLFFLRDAPYATGQILAIDGGRSIGW